uniref:Uncharacterized protein n=2 Tax=Davidia involucrata TaxID=16924 RepID=A0A5B7BSM7_DAVIN
MEDFREDQDQRKRKIKAISYNEPPQSTCTFSNAFATHAASFTSSFPSSYLQDGHDHGHKKRKAIDIFSDTSPPLSKLGTNSGSPPVCGKSSPILSTPTSVLSSQSSVKSTCSKQIDHGSPSASESATLFTSNSMREGETDHRDLLTALRLFERPTTSGPLHNLKAHLQPILLNRLKELAGMEPTSDVGHEMADSVYLLKFLSCSNLNFETVGKKAGRGAMLVN